MAGGAAINVVVKSGTNAYRGTGWLLRHRQRAARAQPVPDDAEQPEEHLTQYGGNLGGPIVKDRLFFFFNVERTTQAVGAGSRLLIDRAGQPAAERRR